VQAWVGLGFGYPRVYATQELIDPNARRDSNKTHIQAHKMKKFIFDSDGTNHQNGVFFFLVIAINASSFQSSALH
jgi:hypothetical protein